MENSEQLGWQARPRIEPSTSRLQFLGQNYSATGGACKEWASHLQDHKILIEANQSRCFLHMVATI